MFCFFYFQVSNLFSPFFFQMLHSKKRGLSFLVDPLLFFKVYTIMLFNRSVHKAEQIFLNDYVLINDWISIDQ